MWTMINVNNIKLILLICDLSKHKNTILVISRINNRANIVIILKFILINYLNIFNLTPL